MFKKNKVNIPDFGDRFCSNNVEYKLYFNRNYYRFYKKGTDILHNEYGPVIENKDGSYGYYINDELHSLNDCAFYSKYSENKQYCVIGIFIGNTKEDFIKKLANILIPNNDKYL